MDLGMLNSYERAATVMNYDKLLANSDSYRFRRTLEKRKKKTEYHSAGDGALDSGFRLT